MVARNTLRGAKSPARVDAIAEWRSPLAGGAGALLLYEVLSGFAIYLLPFSEFNQFNVLLHTLAGLAMSGVFVWFCARHWRLRRGGNLSHYQLLGYLSLLALLLCALTGLLLTWQGVAAPRIDYAWSLVHLISAAGVSLFVAFHLLTLIVRPVPGSAGGETLASARRRYYVWSLAGAGVLLVLGGSGVVWYETPAMARAFSEDYNWRFGADRPFAPSLARLDDSGWRARLLAILGLRISPQFAAELRTGLEKAPEPFAYIRERGEAYALSPEQQATLEDILKLAAQEKKSAGAVDSLALAGSASCGTAGCHEQIYREWLPSAHRYSSLDDMFQRVQTLMASETSPEHTRYCAGCHDPISLFSGAKNAGNITLSTHGADEGSSCIVCHSIVQADVQGNGDYTVAPPRRYIYETSQAGFAKLLSDFLIRVYPEHHLRSYSRNLYKTPEFCAACHKQYIDKQVNTDIGKVQGQNQYDSWKNSRWYHEGDASKTIACRECHMPLVSSHDPARGDGSDYNRDPGDGKHRGHRMLASNQYVPMLHALEGAAEHVALTEKWLRGEIAIPEIADKWTEGPVVRMDVLAPERVSAGQRVSIQIVLTNNKTGHDFPTGPLDMIESWVELKVADAQGNIVFHRGQPDADDRIEQPPLIFKADGFDRRGELIDRHNLWDLVGASYKRSLYPGVTDSVSVPFQCPSMARRRLSADNERIAPGQRQEDIAFEAPAAPDSERLTVSATLWYRKANPEFLDRVYGSDAGVRSPMTAMSTASTVIVVEAPRPQQ